MKQKKNGTTTFESLRLLIYIRIFQYLVLMARVALLFHPNNYFICKRKQSVLQQILL